MTTDEPRAPLPEPVPDTVSGAETAEGPEAGRDRLVSALKRPLSRGQVTAAVLLAVLGFAAVVQVAATGKDDKYAGTRQDELVQLINTLSLASQRAENEIAGLEQTRNSLRNDTDSRRTALERARQQANVLGILAGTLPAVGPGITVTVADPHRLVGTDHLLNGLEELRDAGAEAIEINGTVRVVAQTALKDGPNGGVIIDGQQLSPPYTIEAIGDPHTLATALSINGGFIASIEVEPVNGKVTVGESQNVEIASTRKATAAQYAEPAPAE